MGLGRLSIGEKLAGGAALQLLVFMFLDWFGTTGPYTTLCGVEYNAWEALEFIKIVLAMTIVVALGVAVLRLTNIVRQPPLWSHALIAILGAVSALSILFRIIDPPIFGSLQNYFWPVVIEGTPQLGAFLGLLAAMGVALGGWRALQEGGFSFRSRRRGSSGDLT